MAPETVGEAKPEWLNSAYPVPFIEKHLPNIVAFCGDSPNSGKSTAAKVLQDDFGYTLVKFADPLKDMLRTFLKHCGLTDDQIEEHLEGDKKQRPILSYPFSGRSLMTTLGNGWGRDGLATDIWARLAERKIGQLLATGHRVVIDDLRFKEELDVVRRLSSSLVVHVARPCLIPKERFPHLVDRRIANGRSLDAFRTSIRCLLLKELSNAT